MLSPKRVKWRKHQKGKMRGRARSRRHVVLRSFGLQATECGRITSKQLEASRVAMTRYVKRGGRIWVRIFPGQGYHQKPAETRMGSGKGGVEDGQRESSRAGSSSRWTEFEDEGRSKRFVWPNQKLP